MYSDRVEPQHLRTDVTYLIAGERVRIVSVQRQEVTYRLLSTGTTFTVTAPIVTRLPWAGAVGEERPGVLGVFQDMPKANKLPREAVLSGLLQEQGRLF